jgi:hypothetical protein
MFLSLPAKTNLGGSFSVNCRIPMPGPKLSIACRKAVSAACAADSQAALGSCHRCSAISLFLHHEEALTSLICSRTIIYGR